MVDASRHVRGAACLSAAILVVVLLGWLGWVAFDRYTPPQHNPFKPLDLSHPIGWATGHKLDRLAQHPEQCFAVLDKAGVRYTRIDRANPQAECELRNALTLDRSLAPYSATLSMSCPLTAAVYMWERHIAMPAAQAILGEDIASIETFGSYACRRVNNASTGRWSEHASGDAVDIAGFRLANGRTISVDRHFGMETAEGRFLETVRDGACDLFSATLSPDYNALHKDHFHFDMGLFTVCS